MKRGDDESAGVSVVGIPNNKISDVIVQSVALHVPWGFPWERREALVREVLAAAVPYIEAEIRAKIAAEIETKVDTIRVTPGDQYALRLANVLDGLRAAARVARGTQETTE